MREDWMSWAITRRREVQCQLLCLRAAVGKRTRAIAWEMSSNCYFDIGALSILCYVQYDISAARAFL